MGRFGAWEIILIVVLVMILFNHSKIPSMMKNLADGLKVFKKELKDEPKAASSASHTAKATASTGRATKKGTSTKKTSAKTVKKNDNSDAELTYVEFGAYASMASANAAMRRLTSGHAGLFGDYEFVILEQGAKSPFKLRIAFDGASAAREFVRAAADDGVKCKVVA